MSLLGQDTCHTGGHSAQRSPANRCLVPPPSHNSIKAPGSLHAFRNSERQQR